MKLTPVTLAAAVFTIGAAGFFVGRISSSPNDARAGTDVAAAEVQTRATRGGASAAGSDVPLRPGADRPRTQRASTTAEQRNSRIEDIMRGENALDRGRALLAFIDQLGPGDFEDAVAHFRSLGITDDRMGEYSLLLTAWAKADPIAALEYASANTGGDFARTTILTAWATSDPEAAIRWADSNHTGDGPNPLLVGVIRGIASIDPARATQIMTGMPRSQERGRALDAMMPHVLQMGVDGARAWISSLDDDSLRNGALDRMAPRLAALDPAAAADMLLANPGQAADRRMNDVYREWARQNQSDALAAMGTLPAGDARSNALRGIVSNVASSDPRAAVRLLETYPGDVNDRVLISTAWSSFGNDPSVSANLISRVGDQRAQERMYRRTLETWLERDPSAARNWINSNSNQVPEPVIRRIADRL
jgi:hypothetical protein